MIRVMGFEYLTTNQEWFHPITIIIQSVKPLKSGRAVMHTLESFLLLDAIVAVR